MAKTKTRTKTSSKSTTTRRRGRPRRGETEPGALTGATLDVARRLSAARRFEGGRSRRGDAVRFGSESRGRPAPMLARLPPSRRLRVTMQPGNRSLNLSNAVAVACYEAWRQQGFSGTTE